MGKLVRIKEKDRPENERRISNEKFLELHNAWIEENGEDLTTEWVMRKWSMGDVNYFRAIVERRSGYRMKGRWTNWIVGISANGIPLICNEETVAEGKMDKSERKPQ